MFGQEKAAADADDFSFMQLSDSHIGFARPANADVKGTLSRAAEKINALPQAPAFALHTGDLTHLSKPVEFDDVAEILRGRRWSESTAFPANTTSTTAASSIATATARGLQKGV